MSKKEAKQWIIPCRITMRACDMLVTARTAEEAVEKALDGSYDDIEMDCGEICDWELTGAAKENK
jgi:hypothetical protein